MTDTQLSGDVPNFPQNSIVTDPKGALAVQTPASPLVDGTARVNPLTKNTPAQDRAADPDAFGDTPEVAGVADVQTITVAATGGTWGLVVKNPVTGVSATIANTGLAWNITAAALQKKLTDLNNLIAGDVVVTGGPGDDEGTTPYVLTFAGNYAGPVTPVVSDSTKLTGVDDVAATVVHTTTGILAD